MDILLNAVDDDLGKFEDAQTQLLNKQRHLSVIDADGDELIAVNEALKETNYKVKILQGIANAEPQYEEIRLIAREALTSLSGELGEGCSVEQEIHKLIKFANQAELTYLDILAEIRNLKKKNAEELSQEEVFAQLMALEHKMFDAQIQQDLFILLSNHLSAEIGLEPEISNKPSVELEVEAI